MARFADFGHTNLVSYEDILVAKYTPDGQMAWAKQAGGNGYDYGQSLAVTPDGVSYVTGTFEYSAPFDHLTLTSRGGDDLFLAKYAPDENLEWMTQAGGSGHDGTGVLAVVRDGDVLLGVPSPDQLRSGPTCSPAKRRFTTKIRFSPAMTVKATCVGCSRSKILPTIRILQNESLSMSLPTTNGPIQTCFYQVAFPTRPLLVRWRSPTALLSACSSQIGMWTGSCFGPAKPGVTMEQLPVTAVPTRVFISGVNSAIPPHGTQFGC